MTVAVSDKMTFARELETIIGRVRSVVAARLVVDADDNIETIHVLATRGRTADQIAEDIQAVCAAMFNTTIDRRQLRITQPDEPDDPGHGGDVARLELYGMVVESGRNDCRVHVKLRVGDALYEGVRQGADVVSVRPRLAALAAVDAIEQFVSDTFGPGSMTFTFNEFQELTVGPWGALVASLFVNARESRASSEEWLVGCALVRKDAPDAAVRAVLDAVNGRLFEQRPS